MGITYFYSSKGYDPYNFAISQIREGVNSSPRVIFLRNVRKRHKLLTVSRNY